MKTRNRFSNGAGSEDSNDKVLKRPSHVNPSLKEIEPEKLPIEGGKRRVKRDAVLYIPSQSHDLYENNEEYPLTLDSYIPYKNSILTDPRQFDDDDSSLEEYDYQLPHQIKQVPPEVEMIDPWMREQDRIGEWEQVCLITNNMYLHVQV